MAISSQYMQRLRRWFSDVIGDKIYNKLDTFQYMISVRLTDSETTRGIRKCKSTSPETQRSNNNLKMDQ